MRHFLLAFLWNASGSFIAAGHDFIELPIDATLTEDDLPTDALREVYWDVCSRFFATEGLGDLASKLAAIREPLRMDGLRFVLSTLQLEAFVAVVDSLHAHGLLPAALKLPPRSTRGELLAQLFSALAIEDVRPGDPDVEVIAFAANRVHDRRWRIRHPLALDR